MTPPCLQDTPPPLAWSASSCLSFSSIPHPLLLPEALRSSHSEPPSSALVQEAPGAPRLCSVDSIRPSTHSTPLHSLQASQETSPICPSHNLTVDDSLLCFAHVYVCLSLSLSWTPSSLRAAHLCPHKCSIEFTLNK